MEPDDGRRRAAVDPARWVDPPDLLAARDRMRAIYARLEELLATRRELERS